MREWLFVIVAVGSGCGTSTSTTAITFDACAPVGIGAPGGSEAQLASIDEAIAMWQTEGVAITRDATVSVTIEFRQAAPALYGFYDDSTATIYVNTSVEDSTQRAVTVAHELGHALGLVHVAAATRASVMNPGNLVVAPNSGDRGALEAIWGPCSR